MKGSYNFMKKALLPLGLYDINDNNIDYELLSYAQVLDEMKFELTEMLRECFLSSAVSYGLYNREVIVGKKRDDLSIKERRNMLTLREQIDSSSFTLEKIRSSLESFNLLCDIHEYPSLYMVVLDAIGEYTKEQKSWIREQVQKIMPAHLLVQVVFGGVTWQESDSKSNTFSYIDSLNLSWENIDDLE